FTTDSVFFISWSESFTADHRRDRPLLSINRPVEDLIRNRGFVNELVGEVPFHELGAATKHPNDGPSWKTGRAAAAVRVRIGPPRRDTRMTDGHAVAGVARGRNVG